MQVRPAGARQRPVGFVADCGDGGAVGADFQPDSWQRWTIASSEVPVEEVELSLPGFVGVESGPLAGSVRVEMSLAALDHREAAKGAAAVQIVVREAATDQVPIRPVLHGCFPAHSMRSWMSSPSWRDRISAVPWEVPAPRRSQLITAYP